MADLLGLRIAGAIDNKAAATGSGGGWPNAGKAMINSTEYSTIAAAITAASASDIIKIGQGTFTEDLALNKAVTLIGLGPAFTIITGTGSSTINITAAATLRGLTITNTGAGILKMPVTVDAANVTIENCIITKTGASTTGIGIYHNSGTGLKVGNCEVTVSGATNNWAYYQTSGTVTATITGGRLNGSTLDINGEVGTSTLTLVDPVLVNASKTYSGTLQGEAFDQYGRRLRVKPIGVNDGRMTLTTAVPVTNADVTAAATIYYTPYIGGKCEVYNGSFWIEAPFTEVSLSLSGFTVDKNSDLWIYDNAGTLALERTEWTNDTTRATALAVQDGRYCKSGTLTRLYLGTFRTSATGQCEDSKLKRFVWNNYNRVPRILIVQELTNTWTYTLVAWRQANGSAANQVAVVIGWNEDALRLTAVGNATKDDGGNRYTGIGVNSVTVNSAQLVGGAGTVNLLAGLAELTEIPRIGYSYYAWLEAVQAASGTCTWFGDAGITNQIQSGMIGQVMG